MEIRGTSYLFCIVVAATLTVTTMGVYGSSLSPRRGRSAPHASQQMISREPVEVLKVVSGDTVLVTWRNGRVPVRLRGVGVPEQGDPRHGKAVKFLQNLVENKPLELGFEEPPAIEKDERGRLIGVLFADGENVNQQMIQAGWTNARGGVERPQPKVPIPPAHNSQQSAHEPSVTDSTSQPASSREPTNTAQSTARVHVTPHDKTYHRVKCRLLRGKGSIAILKTEAIRQGYKRCNRCRP